MSGMVTVSGWGESAGHDHRLGREMPQYRYFPAQLTVTSVHWLFWVGARYYGFGVVGLLVCRCTMVLV